MRSIRTAAAALAIVVLTATPALASEESKHEANHRGTRALSWQQVLFPVTASEAGVAKARSRAEAPGTKDLSAYQGVGSWIDIFNTKPWENPGRAVRRMHERGAETIFLQTSTYGERKGIYDDDAIDAYLRHAHRRGMKVVAWYVPAFNQQKVDLARIRRAIRYRSPSGHRFDSFGLDIEATNVSNVALRNDRLIALSTRIRRLAGPNYPLGAITPDPVVALYWPNFPYKRLANLYDVFVPMGYFTLRAEGYEDVHHYTQKGIKTIRRATGDPDVPIHFIGGIADDAGPNELKGFVKAARDQEIAGASLYDYPITGRKSWFEMRALSKAVAARRRAAAAERAEAAAEKRRREREERRERRENRPNDERKDGNDMDRERSAKREKERKAKGGSKERRDPASSASRRDRESSLEDEGERGRHRSRDRRPRRS